ncbi:MAG: enoyl-CoA hydratase/isomerase family protein [Microthrixaceae bacterium]
MNTDTTATVHTESRGDVLVATIDVPGRYNAADMTVYTLLEEALRIDASGYVITGANGSFSSGDDIAMFDFEDMEASDAFLVQVSRLFQRIEALQRPVVAAVDGYALGFGFELALACDVVIATEGALFGLPEIRHGAAPPNAMGRGPSILGRGLVRHLATSGSHWLSGGEAHRLGMVGEVHPPERIVDVAVALANDMADQEWFVAAKRYQGSSAEATYRMVPEVMASLMASDHVAQSAKAYADD